VSGVLILKKKLKKKKHKKINKKKKTKITKNNKKNKKKKTIKKKSKESGLGLAEARAHFVDGSAMWVYDLPDPASVEARCHAGSPMPLRARRRAGRGLLVVALDQGDRMQYVALIPPGADSFSRGSMLETGGFDAAIRGLDEIRPEERHSRSAGTARQERYGEASPCLRKAMPRRFAAGPLEPRRRRQQLAATLRTRIATDSSLDRHRAILD
jgi:hypothetical protein